MAFDLKIANPTLDVQILQLTRDAAGGVLAADELDDDIDGGVGDAAKIKAARNPFVY